MTDWQRLIYPTNDQNGMPQKLGEVLGLLFRVYHADSIEVKIIFTLTRSGEIGNHTWFKPKRTIVLTGSSPVSETLILQSLNMKGKARGDYMLKKNWKKFNKRARQRNITVEISFDDYVAIKNSRQCFYTGRFLSKIPYTPHSLTIDRIDRTKGYTIENIVPCCALFNHIKGNFEDPKNKNKNTIEQAIELSKKRFYRALKRRNRKF